MPLRTASFSRIATFQPLRPVRGSLATLFDQVFYLVSLHLRLPSGLLSLSMSKTCENLPDLKRETCTGCGGQAESGMEATS